MEIENRFPLFILATDRRTFNVLVLDKRNPGRWNEPYLSLQYSELGWNEVRQ